MDAAESLRLERPKLEVTGFAKVGKRGAEPTPPFRINFFARFGERGKILLVSPENPIIHSLAQIARACGRVSVGGDPDKRPVNRQ
jgi:hypothetical protein